MGTKLGKSLIAANQVLGDLNPHMSELRYDVQQLNQFAGILTRAAPDLLDTMDSLSVTARTINGQKRELDVALLAAAGFANNGADIFERGAPYLVRAVSDLLTTSNLLNKYSPELNCTLRNLAEGASKQTRVSVAMATR